MIIQHHHHAIYQCLAEISEPYRLPEPVDFVPPGEDIFHCPKDPESVVADLGERFPEEDLLASGIMVRDGDGKLQLSPMLSDEARGFILLRNLYTAEAYDLLTEQGCVSGQHSLPVLAVLGDKRTRAAIADSECLYVCHSFEDMAYLRSLEFAATSSAGMENMPPGELEAFCKVFGINPGYILEDEDEDEDDEDSNDVSHGGHPLGPSGRSVGHPGGGEPVSAGRPGIEEGMPISEPAECQVVLVAWSPAKMKLEPPPAVPLLWSYFEDLRKHLDVETEDIQTWNPRPEEVDRIEFAMKHRAVPWLRRVIGKSMEISTTPLDFFDKPDRKTLQVPPRDYVAALAQLQQNLCGNNARLLSPDRQQQLWRDFEEKLDSEAINPMRSSALACLDPRERVLRMMLAELSRGLLWKLAVSNLRLSDAANHKGIGRGEVAVPDEVKQTAMSVETVLKLAEEIRRCNESTLFSALVQTAPMVTEARPLQVLAAPTRNSNS